jgi:hypothetical protein
MTKKHIFHTRIRRIVAHRDNPTAPVDAATLLHAESQRLAEIGHPLAQKMAWGMKLAASKLECWGDPACMVRFQKISPANVEVKRGEPTA